MITRNFFEMLIVAIGALSIALWLTNPLVSQVMDSSLPPSGMPLPLATGQKDPWTYNLSSVVPYSWLSRVKKDGVSEMRADLSAKPSLVDARDVYGKTGLMIAAELIDLPRAELLISYGANVNLKTLDNMSESPLHLLIRKLDLPDTFVDDDIKFIKLLIAHGANINEKNSEGRTPFHYISGIINPRLRTEVMGILVPAGANLNAQDNFGDTPLHVAINFLNLNAEDFIEEVMNKYGNLVDPHVRNLKGETLVDYARDNKYMRTVQILCKTGKWQCTREDLLGVFK